MEDCDHSYVNVRNGEQEVTSKELDGNDYEMLKFCPQESGHDYQNLEMNACSKH